ncbi:MAG: caspase family protein [Elusimicrobiota bacterium]
MNRALLTFSLLVVAAFAAASPARAEHDEHEHHEEHKKPLKKRPPTAKPKPKPKSAAPANPHPPAKPVVPAKPGAQAKPPSAPKVQPAPVARPLPKPQPITDPKHFVRHWAPPPSPKTGASGAAITATPVAQVPTAQHTAVFNNTTVVTTIISNQQNEVSPNRYYWHHDGGYNYVHYYSGGAHWYGFYVGPNYYWSRYHANRWWWYDPIAQRYLYFNGGYWWWQDPFAPSTLYVYQSGSYVPYAVAAAAAPAAPAVPVPKPAPPARVYHSDVDAPNYSVDPNLNRFALIVGVEDYAGLPKAAFAERDAAAVRAHLSALGYPDQNIAVLTGTQAARGGVSQYVESWLPARVTDQSRVFVYFSGYGALDPTTGVAYLLPRDGDVRNLPNTGYSLKQLYAALNALPAQEIVVVLDAGFSGKGGRSVRAAGAPPAGANIDVGRGFAGRIVIFSAAGPDEAAGTNSGQGHGLFTYHFLRGLNGGAPQTGDGVTVQSLFDYLTPNVEDAAGRDRRSQTPQLIVPPDGQRRLLIKDLR